MLEILCAIFCVLASFSILKLRVGGKGWKLSDTLAVSSALAACVSLVYGFVFGLIFFIPASLFVSKLRWQSDSL